MSQVYSLTGDDSDDDLDSRDDTTISSMDSHEEDLHRDQDDLSRELKENADNFETPEERNSAKSGHLEGVMEEEEPPSSPDNPENQVRSVSKVLDSQPSNNRWWELEVLVAHLSNCSPSNLKTRMLLTRTCKATTILLIRKMATEKLRGQKLQDLSCVGARDSLGLTFQVHLL